MRFIKSVTTRFQGHSDIFTNSHVTCLFVKIDFISKRNDYTFAEYLLRIVIRDLLVRYKHKVTQTIKFLFSLFHNQRY